jgi:predicted acyltransferase
MNAERDYSFAMQQPQRLVSLDVFRGLTMAAMVIVNNPGDWGNVYAPLLHAEWHGWTPTDLIFPFFLFIVGVSITLSRKTASWESILRRSAIIFALGLFLAGYPRFDLSRWRIPGVLQRIAVCYLAAATFYRLMPGDRRRKAVILTSLATALALIYWAVMMLVPPPGGVAGDLTPEGNLAAWLDRALMEGHLWRPRWDPEGLLSTVPAISTTLLGVVAGLGLGTEWTPDRKAAMLAIGGGVAVVIGLAWDVVFPINKNLWTSSYAFFTAGAASLLLAACYWMDQTVRDPRRQRDHLVRRLGIAGQDARPVPGRRPGRPRDFDQPLGIPQLVRTILRSEKRVSRVRLRQSPRAVRVAVVDVPPPHLPARVAPRPLRPLRLPPSPRSPSPQTPRPRAPSAPRTPHLSHPALRTPRPAASGILPVSDEEDSRHQ